MVKQNRKSDITSASLRQTPDNRSSIFNRTPLQSFFDIGADLYKDFDAMSAVFEAASGEALGFSFSDEPQQRFIRRQPLKTAIIKTLMFVGVKPLGRGFPVLARLIEVLVVHPELDFGEVVTNFAQTHNMTVGTVTRIIDNGLNVRDQNIYDRVTMLTESHPFTGRDALCDLAAFINMCY